MPKCKPKIKPQHFKTEHCFQHQSENIRSYCKSCDQLCCKICLTVGHHGCKVEKLSTIAVNVNHSQEFKDLEHRLDILKRGFSDHQIKANNHLGNIEKYYIEAINDMRKIQEEVARLLDETMKQAEKVKAEDFQTVETISSTCDILEEQIDNIKASLEKKENHKESEAVFIAMKYAKGQLKSFEDRLEKLNTDNTIHQYKFKPEEKLQDLLNELEVLGKLCFLNDNDSAVPILTKPLHVEDIDIQTTNVRCSILLLNKQLLLTDHDQKLVKLFDMKNKKTLAQLQLPWYAWGIVQIKQEELAATTWRQKVNPISEGDLNINIKNYGPDSVTLMTLDGKVKAVYKDDSLKLPEGICVNKSGIVYVVGHGSHKVHQIVPGSDKLELLLSQKDELKSPVAITYCDAEDKIYVGQNIVNILKVFKMK